VRPSRPSTTTSASTSQKTKLKSHGTRDLSHHPKFRDYDGFKFKAPFGTAEHIDYPRPPPPRKHDQLGEVFEWSSVRTRAATAPDSSSPAYFSTASGLKSRRHYPSIATTVSPMDTQAHSLSSTAPPASLAPSIHAHKIISERSFQDTRGHTHQVTTRTPLPGFSFAGWANATQAAADAVPTRVGLHPKGRQMQFTAGQMGGGWYASERARFTRLDRSLAHDDKAAYRALHGARQEVTRGYQDSLGVRAQADESRAVQRGVSNMNQLLATRVGYLERVRGIGIASH
jgi:hypothetical protein